MLKLENISLRFGGLTAVNNVSLHVKRGEIFSIIGPNGAGKTSLFNIISGVYHPTQGRVFLDNHDVRTRFSIRTLGALLGVALLTGIGVLFALNLQPLWERAITDLYVYQQPFSYRAAMQHVQTFFFDLPLTSGLFPALCGALVGALGLIISWRRVRYSPTSAAWRGISRTFQNIRLFPDMTVLENVLVATGIRYPCSVVASVLRLPRYFSSEKKSKAEALRWLSFVGLESEKDHYASALPYGHQRRLEIARALACKPAVILLDEPAAGMNSQESAELMGLIRDIRDLGITVVLIEHHMQVVMGISDRIAVLDYGNLIAEGSPQEIKTNHRVIDAYLGRDLDANE